MSGARKMLRWVRYTTTTAHKRIVRLVTLHGVYMPTYNHYSLYLLILYISRVRWGVYQGQAFWCRRKAVRANFDCVRECTPRAMTIQIFPRPVSFLRCIPFNVHTSTATTESRNITIIIIRLSCQKPLFSKFTQQRHDIVLDILCFFWSITFMYRHKLI